MTEIRAEIRLPTQELREDLPFYTKTLGMRLDMIFPADNPEVAVLSGHGLRLRLQKGAPARLQPAAVGGTDALITQLLCADAQGPMLGQQQIGPALLGRGATRARKFHQHMRRARAARPSGVGTLR